MPITISINIEKVDQKRFVKGKKGRYLDLILFETPDSDYGDYLVKQRAEEGEKMPILGNGKFWKMKNGKKGNTKREEDNDNGSDDKAW